MINSNPARESTSNRLLSALPAGDRNNLLRYAEIIELARGELLDDRDEKCEFAYFPLDAVVSLVSQTGNERQELAMVGRDGATGVYGALGFDSLPHAARVVQVPGFALRVDAGMLRDRFRPNTALFFLLMQYLNALYAQIAQVAICYRRHKIEQRLQTWMAMMFNRLEGGYLKLKQDEIAATLGYTRQSISTATSELQQAGVIRYSRGHIHLIDPERLTANACECYRIMESQYERISPPGVLATDLDHASLTTAANLYIEQMGEAIKKIRSLCAKNEDLYLRQRELLSGRDGKSFF